MCDITALERAGEVFERRVLVMEGRRLAKEPSQLEQRLGVGGVLGNDALVGLLGQGQVLLLLVHVADLEPHVGLAQWGGRAGADELKALSRKLRQYPQKKEKKKKERNKETKLTSRLVWYFCCCL